jgi:hypothetical protein
MPRSGAAAGFDSVCISEAQADGGALAVIADNLISGTHRSTVLGVDRHTPVTGELTNDGARFAQLAISGNWVR